MACAPCASAKNPSAKNSVRNLEDGPRTQLVRGVNNSTMIVRGVEEKSLLKLTILPGEENVQPI